MNNVIRFSPLLEEILEDMSDSGYLLAYEILLLGNEEYADKNILNIDLMSNAYIDNYFILTITDQKSPRYVMINKFIEDVFGNHYTEEMISDFVHYFNLIKTEKIRDSYGLNDEEEEDEDGGYDDYNNTYNGFRTYAYDDYEEYDESEYIQVGDFKYDPTNVRSTFLSLVTKTYPMDHEKEVLQFLPKDLLEDGLGNWYKIIPGDDTTMFTSHLDTADYKQKETKLISVIKDGDEFIKTNGRSILGADDKAGVTIMLYMMSHNVPGLYYFFYGEESGGTGSRKLAARFGDYDYLQNITKCISFDRRKTNSIITSQYSQVCCSNDFGNALALDYNSHGMELALDDTGVFTDSASFMDIIPECTNISVGYENEHTNSEIQNITYLEKLCVASIKVNWKALTPSRDMSVKVNKIDMGIYRPILEKIKNLNSNVGRRLFKDKDGITLDIDTEGESIENLHDYLLNIKNIFKDEKLYPDVSFNEEYIKIELE